MAIRVKAFLFVKNFSEPWTGHLLSVIELVVRKSHIFICSCSLLTLAVLLESWIRSDWFMIKKDVMNDCFYKDKVPILRMHEEKVFGNEYFVGFIYLLGQGHQAFQGQTLE